jgi:hypothetical protein
VKRQIQHVRHGLRLALEDKLDVMVPAPELDAHTGGIKADPTPRECDIMHPVARCGFLDLSALP